MKTSFRQFRFLVVAAALPCAASAQNTPPQINLNGGNIIISGGDGRVTINGRDANDDASANRSGPVTAEVVVSPETPKPGQPYTVQLTVDAGGGGFGGNAPRLKAPAGAELPLARQYSSYSNINGVTSRKIVLTYEGVAPEKPGEYGIPVQSFDLGSRRIDIPKTALNVRELKTGESAYAPVSLRFEVAPGPHYVGEQIPAKIIVAGSSDEAVRAVANPRFGEDDSLVAVPGSERRRVTYRQVDGKSVADVEISFKFTALTSGEKTTKPAADVTLQRDVAPEPGSGIPHGFRSPSSLTVRTVDSAPVRIVISHAPTEGKPASFRGAIGEFEMDEPSLTPSAPKAGEPMKYSFIIGGDTTPERIAPPTLAGRDWIVKEDEPVYGTDQNGRRAKQFNYTLTPLYGGPQKTPAGEVSWFDPVKRAYVVRKLGGSDIVVAGDPPPAETAYAPETKRPPELAPDPKPTGRRRDFAAPWSDDVFLAPQCAAGIILALAAFTTARARRHAAHPEILARRRARRRMRALAAEARRVAKQKNDPLFITRAVAALRAGTEPLCGVNAEAQTPAETLAALPEGADRATLRLLFDAETGARFDAKTAPADIRRVSSAWETTVRLLEKSLR